MSFPEFKLIVAGGRGFNNGAMLAAVLHDLANTVYKEQAVSIVSGMARGADKLGHYFAKSNGVKVYEFPAKWNELGIRAGMVRNEEMGRFADGLCAFWDGQSRGTFHMIQYMQKLNKPVHIYRY
jgi:hypothetical protein